MTGIAYLTANNSTYQPLNRSDYAEFRLTLDKPVEFPIWQLYGQFCLNKYRLESYPFGKTRRGLKKFLRYFGLRLKK